MAKIFADDLRPVSTRILRVLQKDGRISNLKLAEAVRPVAHRRAGGVSGLTRDGFILGYEARLNPDKLGAGMMVFIEVVLDRTTHDAMNASRPRCRCARDPWSATRGRRLRLPDQDARGQHAGLPRAGGLGDLGCRACARRAPTR